MKNLILTIAILVTGVINAQSFRTAKELTVALYARLEFSGFEKALEKILSFSRCGTLTKLLMFG